MKICSVCQRRYEDAALDCEENHGSLVTARSGTREIIANYRLDFLLERDAAGETYQATRTGFDQPFIVKVISPNSLGGVEQREKIQSETRAAAGINHLNIARVYESGSTGDGKFYIVTEPISGQTLGECLRKVGAFPEAEAVMIARHAAEALEAAHSVGVVHRAVSPANIILAQDGQKLAVKLQNFDFGGIEQQSVVAGFSDAKPPIDTLRYMSPEQCAGQVAGAPSDIYSLAVVLYEMLCGRSPFGAPTSAAISDRRINEQPLETLGFDTRALVKHILRESLQKRPEARPQSAGKFARQLRHIEQLLGLPVTTSQEVTKSSTVNESAAAPVVFNDTPTPDAGMSPSEKYQPRAMTTQKIADRILPTISLAASSPIEKIEENTIAAAPFSEPESIRVGKKVVGVESFAAEPIFVKKKESSVIPFESDPISVKKKFVSEPIVVRKNQFEAAALESETIFIKRKKADIAAPVPEVIDLPDADVKKTRKRQSTAPIFANSFNEKHVRHLPTRRPLFIGASLLVLLASVLFGVLLYNRQHQPSAVQPTIARTSPVSSTSQPQETVSDTSNDTTESDVAGIEKSASAAIEKSPAVVSKRENQLREDKPTTDKAAQQNKSPKNQTARENSAATQTDGGTRSRVVSADGTAQTELSTSFDRWVTATNARNVEQQMNYYAPKLNSYYRTRNVSPESVRAEKKRAFDRAGTVDIKTSKPEIALSPDGKSATMRFRKKYVVKEGQRSRNGEVLQELQWVKSGNSWRIVSERDVKVINR
ncbi:MAG TPA: protein kinase [Pyrinomonadaceae bacterium]|nr:protein kinase [Pyrinomonadaceae bacterium]